MKKYVKPVGMAVAIVLAIIGGIIIGNNYSDSEMTEQQWTYVGTRTDTTQVVFPAADIKVNEITDKGFTNGYMVTEDSVFRSGQALRPGQLKIRVEVYDENWNRIYTVPTPIFQIRAEQIGQEPLHDGIQ